MGELTGDVRVAGGAPDEAVALGGDQHEVVVGKAEHLPNQPHLIDVKHRTIALAVHQCSVS
eukprot:SAG11_NODE_7162_length_1185_cov_0.836096_2_plen_61_part_00